MNLYIFRHGMTYFSKNDIPYGKQIESAEILPDGIPGIKKVGEYLKNIDTDVNYTSPYKRCVETAEIVKEVSGKEFISDERLRDYDPEKDTIEDMIGRIKDFTDFLIGNNNQSVAICTHGFPINAIINFMVKGNVERTDLDNYPEPGTLVVIKDKKVEYLNFNS